MYTYEEVLEKINHASVFGSLPGVQMTQMMLEKLGYPQKGIPFIHVAGTNGKGSVCAFLSSIMMECGKKTGTFTSPHLIDFEERIVVDGIPIPKTEVTRLGNLLLSLEFTVQPTMFDYCLAMALLYFKEQQCDILIIETGLGGRLDSTNALGVPEVTVITKIGYDHVAILGDTLTQIASEKAGIIKSGSYLVMEEQEPEARQILVNVAEHTDNLPYCIVSDTDIEQMKTIKMKMKGVHQWENAAAAFLAAKYLLGKVFGIEEELRLQRIIIDGIAKATWPGRLEILSERPFFLVDGAHNGHGVHALAQSLMYLYPNERFHFIMGVMADKDYEKMVEELLPLAIDFATVTPENHRALQAKTLAEYIRNRGIDTHELQNTQDVVTEILHTPTCGNKIIAFGSLYFVGEIKKIWQNYAQKS